jgi:N-acetylmuramidase
MLFSKHLTEQDYAAAARSLGCEVAAIEAVAEVETCGAGFLQDGRLRILFEGHIFHQFTGGRFAPDHPTICHPHATHDFYCKGDLETRGAGELKRLEQAMALDPTAARKSCSIGRFQVMGFNYEVCGYESVDQFWDALSRSEADHLNAFCAFVKRNRLDRYLRARNWEEFARRYNGPGYKQNKYDARLAAAYGRFAAMPEKRLPEEHAA